MLPILSSAASYRCHQEDEPRPMFDRFVLSVSEIITCRRRPTRTCRSEVKYTYSSSIRAVKSCTARFLGTVLGPPRSMRRDHSHFIFHILDPRFTEWVQVEEYRTMLSSRETLVTRWLGGRFATRLPSTPKRPASSQASQNQIVRDRSTVLQTLPAYAPRTLANIGDHGDLFGCRTRAGFHSAGCALLRNGVRQDFLVFRVSEVATCQHQSPSEAQ